MDDDSKIDKEKSTDFEKQRNIIDDITKWRPTVVCLSSGGIRGLSQLGSIFWFWKRGILDNVTTYIGSSVGAIICTMLACGWWPSKILEQALETTLFRDFSDVKWTQIIHEYGLVPNSSFDDALAVRLTDMIMLKIGKMPTLKEFYEITGKRVIHVIVSLREERPIYADHNSHPDMNLLTAMRATSNSPIIFGKLEHQKDFLVDGAIIIPFPIGYLDDGNTDILGIAVQDKRSWSYKDMTAISYYDRIMSLPLTELTNYAIANASDKCLCIVLPVKEDMSMMDDGSNIDSRLRMFMEGYRFTDQFVKTKLPQTFNPTSTKIPLTEEAIRACLKTHSVKTLFRCMRDDPQLLSECLRAEGLELSALSDINGQHDQNGKRQKKTELTTLTTLAEVRNNKIIPANNYLYEQADEILELPRVIPGSRNSFGVHEYPEDFIDDIFHRMYPGPEMPAFRVMINIQMDERMLEELAILGERVLGMIDPGLRLLEAFKTIKN